MKLLFINFILFICICNAFSAIFSKNNVYSIFFLISIFINSAFFLININIGFISFAYIIIYIGAVAILFLFVIMMVNFNGEGQYYKDNRMGDKHGCYIHIIANSFVGMLFLMFCHFNTDWKRYIYSVIGGKEHSFFTKIEKMTNIHIPHFDIDVIFNNDYTFQTFSIGMNLYTNYSIWLIFASIILMISIFGAIIISFCPLFNLMVK